MSPQTDEFIKQDIIDHLVWDNSIDANDIHVSVDNGIAELTGTVPGYTAKLAAEEDTLQVKGVIEVDNALEIVFPPEKARPGDAAITSNIENKLLWNSSINAANITVETKDGVVTLMGNADTFWEKKLAEEIANNSYGVIWVDNKLSVNLVKTVVDIDIEQDIKNALRRNVFINETLINVDVNNGSARLSGVVPYYVMKKDVIDTAMLTAGVTDVIDEITIG